MKKMHSARMKFALCVLLVASVLPISMIAQGLFGSISGIVTDSTGAAIPGAKVTVTNIATNVSVTLRTNNAGAYEAANLNPGTYQVQASATGFESAVIRNIVLHVAENPKESLQLQVGQSAQTVQVTSESSLLPSQESMLNQTITSEQYSQLPLVGGGGGQDPWALESLSAGVSQQVGEGGFAEGNARINGGRPRMDSYVLDGTTVQATVSQVLKVL